MINPTKVKIGNKIYPINTDFRVALKCNKIALDTSIGDYERALAVIYTLFGENGLNDFNNHSELLSKAKKYLACGQDENLDKNQDIDMDFEQDEKYIKSSFKQDYNYDPYSLGYLHWYDFYNDLCNLSNSEFGNCCVLNRVRNIRNFDISNIKDLKQKKEIENAKKQVALKKKAKVFSEKQENSIKKFKELAGITS